MPDIPANLADAPAHVLARLFASGDASPVEACSAVLARIERFNAEFKAFVCVDAEGAQCAARASEARWSQKSPLGPLDGVPISIKDLILTKGLPTLRGSLTVDENQPWDVDSPVTARLREAGAVLLGKTATPEFGCKAETNSPRSGLTRNPWNPTRTPGGSSGGATVAVALGMGPIAVGTDGAGSVRIPAAFCGTFGLKPSFGRVPSYPLSPMGTAAHLGPHTMDVRDAALAMNVMKRPDARDWTSLPLNDEDYTAVLSQNFTGLRIAWSPRLGYATVHPEVAASVRDAVRSLESAGAQVEEVDPGFEDPLDVTTGLWFAGAWMVWNTLTSAQQAVTDPDFREQVLLGSQISALHLQQLHVRRGVLGSHMRQFMERYDLLVTPSVAVPAFDIRLPGSEPMSAKAMLAWTPFSYPFNLTQQPACTVPCGLTADGMPIGIQFVGPMFRDDLVLRAAAAYEAIRPIPRPAVVLNSQRRT